MLGSIHEERQICIQKTFNAPLLIIASQNDIFFPADRVFKKAGKLFRGPVTTAEIDSLHLPSEDAMVDICKKTVSFFGQTT